MLFLQILLGLAWLLAVLAAFFGLILPWFLPYWSVRRRIAVAVASLCILAGLLTAFVSVVGDGNQAGHCGAGTRYVEERHYNPATKTTVREWLCVVDR